MYLGTYALNIYSGCFGTDHSPTKAASVALTSFSTNLVKANKVQ